MAVARTDSARWWTLVGFCLVLFVSVSFKSMVGIAVPDLQQDLGASLGQIQWLLNAYTLMLAALLLTGGALADRLGRRRVYVTGLAIFGAGAVACLASPDATLLDLSSGLMGIGGAIIFSAGAALLSCRFTGPDRAVAFASFGTVVAAAAASGPLLAGVLIDGFGWRGVFAVLALLAVAGLLVELLRGASVEEPAPPARQIDWAGPVAFTGAIFFLVFALIRGNDEGFGSLLILGCLSAAAVLLAVFVLATIARNRPDSLREPMLDLAVIRRPSVGGAALGSFVLGFVAFGLSFYIAIYLGGVLLNSATETGLKFLPMTAVAFAVAPIGAWLMRRLPMRPLLAGCLLLMAGGAAALYGIDRGSDWTVLVPGFVLIGLGSGAIVPPLVSTAVSVVPQSRAGIAAAINNTARQLGVAFGVAGLGAYFQARVASRLDEVPGVDGDALAGVVVSGDFAGAGEAAPADVRDQVASAAPEAFFAGMNDLFLMIAVIAAAGGAIAVSLIRRADFVIPPGGRETAAEPAKGLAAAR